jgi:ABC-type glutathione transport system ATPase component
VRSDTMDYYGITKDFSQAGFFETESVASLLRDLKTAIYAGGLVAISGLSGSGKTVSLWRLQETLAREGKIILSRSLFVEKDYLTGNPATFNCSPNSCSLIGSSCPANSCLTSDCLMFRKSESERTS